MTLQTCIFRCKVSRLAKFILATNRWRQWYPSKIKLKHSSVKINFHHFIQKHIKWESNRIKFFTFQYFDLIENWNIFCRFQMKRLKSLRTPKRITLWVFIYHAIFYVKRVNRCIVTIHLTFRLCISVCLYIYYFYCTSSKTKNST